MLHHTDYNYLHNNSVNNKLPIKCFKNTIKKRISREKLTPFRIENAQSNVVFSVIYSHESGRFK